MDGRGVRFQGNLDPTAEEFRPQNASQAPNQFALIHPQVYYRYPCSSSYPVSFEGVHPPSAYIGPTPRPTLTNAASSRSLLLSLVPLHVTESMVRTELQVFGAVRAVQMESIGEGIVTVHFYDLRHAQAALMEIQEQHMKQQSRLGQHYSSLLMGDWGCDGGNSTVPMPLPGSRGLVGGQAVWAQFAVPSAIAGIPDWQNQGTLVVFNLDDNVSTSMIKELFEAFGPVKELRETPMKRQHRFVEFYDVRDAARALLEMSGKEVNGKRLVVEFGRPGGQGRRLSSSAESSSNTKNSSSSSSTNDRRNASCPRLFGHSSETVQVLPHSFYQTKKSGFSRESAASSSMAETATEGQHEYPLRRNSRKNPTNYAPSQSNQSIRRSSSSRNRHQKRQVDANFLFKEDAMEEANIKDARTTVMIKNIPNKYSQKLLLNMLDNHCIHCNEQIAERGGDEEGEPLSAYDFVYLPIDFTNKCNVGYGFVNLTSPEAAWRLYKSFHLQAWEVFNSRKICQVTYARLQGLDALKEHFRNSKFACDTDEYLPVVFSPPRDGKLLTEPVAIGGHAGNVQKAARDRRRRKVDDLPQMDGGDWSTTSSNKLDGGDDDEDHEDVGDDSRLSEVLLSSCALSTEEAQQQRNGLSCGRVS